MVTVVTLVMVWLLPQGYQVEIYHRPFQTEQACRAFAEARAASAEAWSCNTLHLPVPQRPA